MKTLIVLGVGNPGPEYAKTRHNIGWRVLDRMADRGRATFARADGVHAETAAVRVKSARLLLVKPLTFVNNTGELVPALRKVREDLEDALLVVLDDANLPLGKLRVRKSGSSGGHNGLESIIQSLGHSGFARLRIGIDRVRGGLRDHVLGRFEADEESAVGAAVSRAAEAVASWALEGAGKCMSKFNRDPETSEDKG